MTQITSKYGYSVGEIVELKTPLFDENHHPLLAGMRIKIVAITPKVRIIKDGNPVWSDTKEYFYNAVIAGQANYYANRIRADFVTIKKIK